MRRLVKTREEEEKNLMATSRILTTRPQLTLTCNDDIDARENNKLNSLPLISISVFFFVFFDQIEREKSFLKISFFIFSLFFNDVVCVRRDTPPLSNHQKNKSVFFFFCVGVFFSSLFYGL